MSATITFAPLAKHAAKRDQELTARLHAAGYELLSAAASAWKSETGKTRYCLEFMEPGRERFDLLPGYGRSHTLSLDGWEHLDRATADTAMLRFLCAFVRRTRYGKVLNEVRHTSGYTNTTQDELHRAEEEYGRAAARIHMAERGYNSLGQSMVDLNNSLAQATRRLDLAIDNTNERAATLDQIAPMAPKPTNYEAHELYAYQRHIY